MALETAAMGLAASLPRQWSVVAAIDEPTIGIKSTLPQFLY